LEDVSPQIKAALDSEICILDTVFDQSPSVGFRPRNSHVVFEQTNTPQVHAQVVGKRREESDSHSSRREAVLPLRILEMANRVDIGMAPVFSRVLPVT